MPNVGLPEMIVLLVIALMVFGPKKLPEMGRTVGKSLREFRRASAEFRSGLRLEDEPPRVPSPGSEIGGATKTPSETTEPTEPPPGDTPKT